MLRCRAYPRVPRLPVHRRRSASDFISPCADLSILPCVASDPRVHIFPQSIPSLGLAARRAPVTIPGPFQIQPITPRWNRIRAGRVQLPPPRGPDRPRRAARRPLFSGARKMGRPAGIPNRPWTSEDDERLRELIGQGLSRHAIAVRLGRSDTTIESRAKALQIELRVRPRAPIVGRAPPTVTN